VELLRHAGYSAVEEELPEDAYFEVEKWAAWMQQRLLDAH
jgi:hypothetical protein